MRRTLLFSGFWLAAVVAIAFAMNAGPFPPRHAAVEVAMSNQPSQTVTRPDGTTITLPMTEEQWKQILTPQQFHVLRKHGTERAFTGEYHDTKTPGIYCCAACGQELFRSDDKFDSGCGWPSYFQPINDRAVGESVDNSWLMTRTEVHCSRCGSHLGHVFNDGPAPTGLRYCMNSVALQLVPQESQTKRSE